MFIAHIGAMDAFARGLTIADRILMDPRMAALRDERYASFKEEGGRRFEAGKLSLVDLRNIAAENPDPQRISAKQEQVENLINDASRRRAISWTVGTTALSSLASSYELEPSSSDGYVNDVLVADGKMQANQSPAHIYIE